MFRTPSKFLSALALVLLVSGLLAGDAAAQSVKITLSDGTILQGPTKLPGSYFFPKKAPLHVVNVPCPSGSVNVDTTKSAKTTWAREGKNTIPDWGLVSFALSTQHGMTIGASTNIQIGATIPADPYSTKEIVFHARYAIYKFTLAPADSSKGFTTMFVHVPIGWMQEVKKVPPTCPCPQIQGAKSQLDGYQGALPPGRLKDACGDASEDLERALARFVETDPAHLDRALLDDLGDASQLLVAGLADGDQAVLGPILDTLAFTSDQLVQRAIEAATLDIIDDMNEIADLCAGEAMQLHFDAVNLFSSGQHLDFAEAFELLDRALDAAERSLENVLRATRAIFFDVDSDDPNDIGAGQADLGECMRGTVGLGNGLVPQPVLGVNGLCPPGGIVTLAPDKPLNITMDLPLAGGDGRFALHGMLGLPTADDVFLLPADIGGMCFNPLLFHDPLIRFDNLGIDQLAGGSFWLGQPLPDPLPGPSSPLLLPLGDPSLTGLDLMLQGLVIDPGSKSNKGLSTTNGLVIHFE